MKQANNNEVDLLLRSLAGAPREARSPSGYGTGDLSNHLDADELNSYAEGVVPAPARARYIEHLADCEACRGIVIGLTQAAGVANRYEVPQSEGGANFWQKLAALFSPAVLRFAVPALVLTAVIGISLLALQQRRQSEFIAQNHPADSAPSSSETSKAGGALNPSTEATPPSLAGGTSSALDNQSKDNQAKKKKGDLQDQKTQLAPAPPPVSNDSTVAKSLGAKDSAQDSAQSGEGAGVATTQPYAPEPKAAAPPASRGINEEAEKPVELAKERSAKRDDDTRSRDELRNQPSDDGEHGPNRSRSNTAQSLPSSRNAGLMGARGPSGLDKNKVSVVETRSVSGRRFTREDNVWVDTDYNAPRATVKIVRGSEQFRALVADESGLRAIADQLSGVVIVVWKNRAYRIQ